MYPSRWVPSTFRTIRNVPGILATQSGGNLEASWVFAELLVVGAQKVKCALAQGAFQFLDRLPGRVCAKVNANAHCARESPKCPDTRGLRPRRIPELARALEPTLILRAGRLHRPAAQRFLPPLCTPILPPLLVLLQMDHPAGPPFPRLLRPSCSSSPKPPCFHPWR
jgi:hypothetical protein